MHHVKDENYYVLLQMVPEVIKMLAELHSLEGKGGAIALLVMMSAG